MNERLLSCGRVVKPAGEYSVPLPVIYRKYRRSSGSVFLELALIIPTIVLFIVGSIGIYFKVRVKNALEIAAGEALLMSDLNMTPEETPFGIQVVFTDRYETATGGKIELGEDSSSPVPSASRYCKGGMSDLSCGATWAIMTAWRSIHSAQIGGLIESVDGTVTYGDIPVDSGVDSRFGKYRKLTISLKANWRNGIAPWLVVTGPTEVSRTEAIG